MKKILLITFAILALLLLAACSNGPLDETLDDILVDTTPTSHDEEAEEAPQPNDMPQLSEWAKSFFTEEEIASGEMLTVSVSGDYAAYHTLEELLYYSSVTDIVKAVVLDERVEWLDTTLPIPEEYGVNIEYVPPSGRPNTLTRIQVLEVFHGDTSVDDTIEVLQRGGQIGNFTLINRHQLYFSIGDIYVFFLCRAVLPDWFEGEHLPTLDPFPMFFPNPTQAVYHIPIFGEDASSRSSSQALQSINPLEGSFTLELGDLVQLWINNLDSETDLDTAIGGIQVRTTDGMIYTLDELSDMPDEEVSDIEFTQESLQAVLDSGAVLAE